MSSYAPYHSLALEEPSEGRTTARAHRDMARSQSPQNPMRNSTSNLSVNSPKGRDSAKNDLTVDSLINKIDGILKQSQSPVKSQSNPLRQSLNFSQPTPFNQVSDPIPASRQSISIDNKAKKNDIFAKKVYDNPLWNNQPVVTNSIRVQTPKPSEKNYELFPIRESPNMSTISNPQPKQPLNITGDMGDIKSRINDLENKIKTFGSPKSNNSDVYATPRGQSVQPATRASSVFATPAPQETFKRSPYADRNYASRSVERQRSPSLETNPRQDAEVSEKICQTIDQLIQTHLLSPSKTMPASKNFSSPPQSLYNTATNNPLYKSSITTTTEPAHNLAPRNYVSTYSSPQYDPRPAYESKYEPSNKYEPKTDARPYEPYQPYDSSTDYKPYERSPIQESKYEARPAYETKYEPCSKYESKYEPYNKYETKRESRPAYEPYKPYQPKNGYPESIYESKYETRPAYEPYESFKSYDPLSSYEKDYKPYSSESYAPSSLDYDGHRPRYVRPLHRNSPPRYPSNSNWSSPKMDYISPRQDYYNTDDIYSLLTTPVRGQPQHQDSASTDKKLKKLTLKSKVSEEKDDNNKHGKKQDFKSSDLQSDNEHHDADALPLPAKNKAKTPKTHKKGKSIALDDKPLYNNGNIRKRNYKAGELVPDDEFRAGGLLGDQTPRKNYRAAELSDDSVDTEVEEIDDDEQEEKEIEKEIPRHNVKGTLRQSRISRDVPDDGKAWNMVHQVPSSIFEEEESGFDFSQPAPKVEKKQTERQNKPPKQNKPQAMLWTMDESAPMSQRGSVSNLSDSVRRSSRKPVLAHCFERAERGGC